MIYSDWACLRRVKLQEVLKKSFSGSSYNALYDRYKDWNVKTIVIESQEIKNIDVKWPIYPVIDSLESL